MSCLVDGNPLRLSASSMKETFGSEPIVFYGRRRDARTFESSEDSTSTTTTSSSGSRGRHMPVFINQLDLSGSETDDSTASRAVPTSPLATHSLAGVPSPSPREDAKKSSPRLRLIVSGKTKLKHLLGLDITSADVPPPLHTSRQRSASVDCISPRAPQANSLPTSPREVLLVNQHIVFDEPTKAAARTRDIEDMLSGSATSNDDTDSMRSAQSMDEKKTRDKFIKAASGGSTRFGASGTLDFTNVSAPIVRVKSHGSIDELKRRIQHDAVSSTDSEARRAGSAPELDSSTTPIGADENSMRCQSLPVPRVSQLARKLSIGKMTYSLIEYNPDPMGLAEWERLVVPNNQIDSVPQMRMMLERATRSEQMQEPFRLCKCKKDCREHVSPDAAAKIAAIYVVELANVAHTRQMRRAIAALPQGVLEIGRGGWAERYTVADPARTNFEKTPCTHHYRFKMFA